MRSNNTPKNKQNSAKKSQNEQDQDKESQGKQNNTLFDVQGIQVYYGDFLALEKTDIQIPQNQITSLIGPSGCGKSTFLRCFNRMNDLIPEARVKGKINYQGENIYDDSINPMKVRRQIGMVFQKPNPFPKSIYENIAFGPRANGYKGNMDELVEQSLSAAALWDEVKDKLKESGTALSGGQQQRLCIARAIAIKPDVLLMDEPCSALDPISTKQIEELCHELKENYTIIIVTHNMQQASRISDLTAFFNTEADESGKRRGKLVEVNPTEQIFDSPQSKEAKDYISGQFG